LRAELAWNNVSGRIGFIHLLSQETGMKRFSIRPIVAGILACTFAVASLVYIGGCETVKGAGKDVQHVGEAGERAISK
jgi:predicted small secreted protein